MKLPVDMKPLVIKEKIAWKSKYEGLQRPWMW